MERSGFVAVVGRPNVGKSTLVNALVGQKVSIVSDKPQTTRNRIMAVIHRDRAQVVLVDTPGVHRPRHRLGEYMATVVERSLEAVDLVLHVVDITAPVGRGDRELAGRLARLDAGRPVLVLNKVDLALEAARGQVGDDYFALCDYYARVPVSARSGYGVAELEALILANLPPGPAYFPPDVITDQPQAFIIAETVREKALKVTREEVPHSLAVAVEELTPRPGGMLYVRAVIYVERESQKGIIIGQHGARLRAVGSDARAELEPLLGSPLYLDLWVRVRRDWRNHAATLRALGYTVTP